MAKLKLFPGIIFPKNSNFQLAANGGNSILSLKKKNGFQGGPVNPIYRELFFEAVELWNDVDQATKDAFNAAAPLNFLPFSGLASVPFNGEQFAISCAFLQGLCNKMKCSYFRRDLSDAFRLPPFQLLGYGLYCYPLKLRPTIMKQVGASGIQFEFIKCAWDGVKSDSVAIRIKLINTTETSLTLGEWYFQDDYSWRVYHFMLTASTPIKSPGGKPAVLHNLNLGVLGGFATGAHDYFNADVPYFDFYGYTSIFLEDSITKYSEGDLVVFSLFGIGADGEYTLINSVESKIGDPL